MLARVAGGVVVVELDEGAVEVVVVTVEVEASVPTGANGFRRPGLVAGGSAIERSVSMANDGF